MKYKYINYIVTEFQKYHPTASTERLEQILLKSSEDDLYRLANAIDRFGLETLMIVKHDLAM